MSLAGTARGIRRRPQRVSPAIARPEAVADVRAAGSRNGFLDVIRSVAIMRVLVWHTYGTPWLSYLVASIPLMFFVAGTLMAQSIDRSGPLRVLRDRFQRLLVPLWLFAAVAIGVMLVYEVRDTTAASTLPLTRLEFWFFPIWDPIGSNWGVTWWASLWYLRCLTWLLLLTPPMLWVYRRTGPAVLVLPLLAIAGFEYAERTGHAVRWQMQDLSLYSFFWMLGFAYRDRWLDRIPRPARAVIAVLCGSAAIWWMQTQDVPGGVVNSSYPAHLLVALTWLFGALTFERPLAKIAIMPVSGHVVRWVNNRSLTIYLWHAAGLFCAYHLVIDSDLPHWQRVTFALPVVVAVTFSCVMLFGWVEDIAGRRPARLWPADIRAGGRKWPLRVAVAASGSVMLASFFVLGSATVQVNREAASTGLAIQRAAPPSGVGLRIRTSQVTILPGPPARGTWSRTGPVEKGELDEALQDWMAENAITGIAVGLRRVDGTSWSGAAGGNDLTAEAMKASDRYDIASVTKTFTVALVMQLVEEGSLRLDDPLSYYVAEFPRASEITIRELIQHTSGIAGTDGEPPNLALTMAGEEPLMFAPGTGFEYSTPGYFLLGLVVEDVTRQSYTEALRTRLLDPLALDHTFMDEEVAPLAYSTHPYHAIVASADDGDAAGSRPSLLRRDDARADYHGLLWSSAGIESTVEDLAHWGVELWGKKDVVSPATVDEMTTFLGPEFQYTGLGTYPYCPCWTEDGRIHGERWGHLGKTGQLEYDPVDGVALAFYTNETVLDERVIVAYDKLSATLRQIIRGRPLPPFKRE